MSTQNVRKNYWEFTLRLPEENSSSFALSGQISRLLWFVVDFFAQSKASGADLGIFVCQ